MDTLVNTINGSEIFDEDEWIDLSEDFYCLQNTNQKLVLLLEESKSSQEEPTPGASRLPRVNASIRQSVFKWKTSYLDRFRANACKSADNLVRGLEDLELHVDDVMEELCELDIRIKNLEKNIIREEETAVRLTN